MIKHVIFFDASCPLCQRAINHILHIDQEERFLFAPLKGTTAKRELADLKLRYPDLDTIVLLQKYGQPNEEIFLEGKAILRICWILGGRYTPLGILSFLPSPLFDWMYRIVARYRYRIFQSAKKIDQTHYESRFLP